MIALLRRLLGKHDAAPAPEARVRQDALRNAARARELAQIIRDNPDVSRRRELILRLESRSRQR